MNRPAGRAHLVLYFRSEPFASLEGSHFTHPEFDAPCDWGLDEESDGATLTFKGRQVLATFFVHQLATTRKSHSAPGGVKCDYFEGAQGSPAATLNNLITRPPKWLFEMFGADSDGHVMLERMVKRKNRDFSKRAEPVGTRLLFNRDFGPEDIDLHLDDTPRLCTPDEFRALERAVREGKPCTLARLAGEKTAREDVPDTTRLAIPSVLLCPPPPQVLLGREDLLNSILGQLAANVPVAAGARQPVLMLRGWPGVGKSTFAAALCHAPEIHRAFPDGVLWASLGQTPNLTAILASWAAALSVSLDSAVMDAPRCSLRLASAARDRQLLLVVDDVWRPSDCSPLMIGGPNARTVCTTRLTGLASALDPSAVEVCVPPLSEYAAIELLRILAAHAVAQEPALSVELVRSVEYLPLAIRVAGRLLQAESQTGWGVGELLDSIRSDAARLLREAPPADAAGLPAQMVPTVASLLRRSTDTLPEAALECFMRLGALAGHPATFDLDAMKAIWQVRDARPTVRILISRGLLEPAGGRYQIHALLAAHARSLWEEQRAGLRR